MSKLDTYQPKGVTLSAVNERRGFCPPKIAFQNPRGCGFYWLRLIERGEPMSPRNKPRTAFRDHAKRRKPGDLHTIPSFCVSNAISKSMYFSLKRKGLQPREIEIDGRVLITPEAEADWRREREAATLAKRQRAREH